MEHQKQVEILKELIRQLDNKVNVDAEIMYRNPTSAYTCPQMAKKEWDQFFKNHPQLIGLAGDLPTAKSFLTTDDFGVPILATRDEEGKFRAFLNVCRHRGVKLVSERRGSKTRFACPFHAWTYDNAGSLVAVPQQEQFGEIDKSCLGLIELPAVEQYGMLWVHPQPNGHLDVDLLLGEMAPELASWHFGKMVAVDTTVIDMKLNWKLANDTFGETYHFQKLHKNTLGKVVYGDNLSYEAMGKNHRFVFASRTIDAERLKPEEDWRLLGGATMVYYIFPNIQLIMNRGTVDLVKIYPDPDNPGRSVSNIGHYFSEKVVALNAPEAEDVDLQKAGDAYEYDPARLKSPSLAMVIEIFTSTIRKEDYAMGELIQASAENGTMEYVIFGRNEPALHHYHNTYRAALELPPLEEYRG
ncbi:MAG: aromatic ring-hydroxylating dioxygenase subunit alpha [Sneathiella sp.]|uniref:aromatic ring-hydroxylating oxygenase subunit alpha n=1 Tax=Sneathiella sp. TaxID=1964365 RepID=UPI003003955D